MGRADNVMEVSPSGVSSGVLVGHERPDPYVIQWDDWEERGNCFGTSAPDVFVPSTTPRRGSPPPTQCITCDVKAQCLAKGRRLGAEGWWGGVYLRSAKSRNFMSEPDKVDAYALWQQGKSDEAIGKELGFGTSTVCRWRIANGLEAVNAKPEIDDSLMHSYFDNYLTVDEVAELTGRSRRTVFRWREKNGRKSPVRVGDVWINEKGEESCNLGHPVAEYRIPRGRAVNGQEAIFSVTKDNDIKQEYTCAKCGPRYAAPRYKKEAS